MDNLLKMDGYNDCIIGIAERFDSGPFYVYDKGKVIEKLMGNDDMSYEDAIEFFEYNQIGAWVGDSTPAFMISYKEDYD